MVSTQLFLKTLERLVKYRAQGLALLNQGRDQEFICLTCFPDDNYRHSNVDYWTMEEAMLSCGCDILWMY